MKKTERIAMMNNTNVDSALTAFYIQFLQCREAQMISQKFIDAAVALGTELDKMNAEITDNASVTPSEGEVVTGVTESQGE